MTPAQRRLIRFFAELLVARHQCRKLQKTQAPAHLRVVSVAKKSKVTS